MICATGYWQRGVDYPWNGWPWVEQVHVNETHSWLVDVIWVWIMGIVTDTPLYISPPTRRRGESWRQCLSIAWIKTRQCGLEWGLPKLSGCPKFRGSSYICGIFTELWVWNRADGPDRPINTFTRSHDITWVQLRSALALYQVLLPRNIALIWI